MPLTSVVQYFNEHLPDFHPQAQLGRDACFECLAGRVSARVAGYRLFPRQAPVLVTGTGEVFGWSGKVLIESDDGRRVSAKSLYVHAWDSEDVIFLDRFLRTLHALHHLSLGDDRDGLLALDVHLRHVAALPERHGQVFETLLHRLGLAPCQIVLRLPGAALQGDPHVRAAALSFVRRGYGLLAARPPIADTDWALLRALGVQWVTPAAVAWQGADYAVVLGHWAQQAQDQGIGLWLDGIGSPAAVARAADLGADLIEGDLIDGDLIEGESWEPAARRTSAIRSGQRWAETPCKTRGAVRSARRLARSSRGHTPRKLGTA